MRIVQVHAVSVMRLFVCGFFILVIGFGGCTNEPGTVGLTNSTFSSDYGVVVVDTTTVSVSTVLLDSFPTSNTGSLLVGGYQDTKLGRLQAAGYVQIGIGDAWEPPATAVFDSLVLVMDYTGYSYGDTAIAQTLSVHRLVQTFKTYTMPQFWIDEGQYSVLYADNSKFNSSAMRSDPQTLGSRTLRYRPGSQDSLTIRLSDDLGKEWLQLAKDKSQTITNQDKFLEYFKGMVIVNASDEPFSTIGVKTEGLKIRLYYRELVQEQLKQQYQEFPFATGLFNYSRITADRTGTILEGINQQRDEFNTNTTEQMAFIQSGSGLVTKITFPHIAKVLDGNNVLIVNHAQLIIEPLKESFTAEFPLPSTLTLYQTDKSNLPIQRIPADYSTTDFQQAYISIDKEFDTSTGYIFTLTQYIQNLLNTEGNQEKGLLIMPPPDEINQSVNRVYLGAGSGTSYRVRLKISYTYQK